MSQALMEIPGPAGAIEARYRNNPATTTAVLICHPHPLYGGSMFDAVVASLCNAAASMEVSSLSFNFRGVGASGGCHDQGIGEVEDVRFLAHWLLEQPGIEQIGLGGYSFGAIMALLAAADMDIPVRHLMLVAPPLQMTHDDCRIVCPATIVVGEQDTIVDPAAVGVFTAAKDSKVELYQLAGADHFFMGYHQQIEQIYRDSLAGITAPAT